MLKSYCAGIYPETFPLSPFLNVTPAKETNYSCRTAGKDVAQISVTAFLPAAKCDAVSVSYIVYLLKRYIEGHWAEAPLCH